jgi:hypothetical protein
MIRHSSLTYRRFMHEVCTKLRSGLREFQFTIGERTRRSQWSTRELATSSSVGNNDQHSKHCRNAGGLFMRSMYVRIQAADVNLVQMGTT